MPNSISDLKPFPRRDFIPAPRDMSNALRLRHLIETHAKLRKDYAASYKSLLETIDVVKDGRELSLSGLSQKQKETLTQHLITCRDETARFYTQALRVFESMANELAPGTFPQEDMPTTSWDIGDLIDKVLEWLAGLFREVGDVFGHVGWADGEAGMDWTADRIDDGRQALKEYWQDDDDE